MEALIEKIDPIENDHLIFIGDYIDRGPDSKSVVDVLLQLGNRCRCTFLRGNHEAMLLNYLDYDEAELWQINGGDSTLASYSKEGWIDIPEEHVEFFRDTVYYHDEPDFFFVHAGLKPDLTILENLERYSSETFLWERSHLSAPELAWEKPIVCGHTPQRKPIDAPKLICIDTGCVYVSYPGYGTLTAILLPEREMIQVPYQEV